MSFVVRKKAQSKKNVQSVREPSSIREMGDVDFGSLDLNKSGQIIVYDVEKNKFVLRDPETILEKSAEDNDIADNVISALENEIDLGEIVPVVEVDGGTF